LKQLPVDVIAYKRTPEFDQDSIPKGLLREHQTKSGVWGKITILQGKLLYTINEPETEQLMLSPEVYGVVEPTVLHQKAAVDNVRFYVEFYR